MITSGSGSVVVGGSLSTPEVLVTQPAIDSAVVTDSWVFAAADWSPLRVYSAHYMAVLRKGAAVS